MLYVPKSSVAVAALAIFLASPVALGADLGKSGAYTPADYQEPAKVNWTGFYAGAQVGYGIASHKVTGISTKSFEAVPSKCWAEFAQSFPDIGNPWDPTDERVHDAEIHAGASVTNVTEEECSELREHLPDHETVTSGYDPEVAAHTVTEKYTGKHSDSGLIGGVRLGADYSRGVLLGGVFGEYNWAAIDGKDGEWSIGGRAGVLLHDRVLAYGLVAYTQSEYGDVDFTGISVGGGLEYALTGNVFVGMEYAHTFYDEETIVNTPGLKVTDELDEDRFLATLKVKLGSFGN